MRRAAAAGYDGVVNYCADGQAMHRMIETGCRLLDLPLVQVKSFSYLVGTLAPALRADSPSGERVSARRLVESAGGDAERGHDAHRARLWRVWSDAEADWQLSRAGAIAVSDGDAVLTGSVATVADAARSRYLVVDDILWASAGNASRQRLLAELLAQAAGDGAGYVVVSGDGLRGRPAVSRRGIGPLPPHDACVPDAVVTTRGPCKPSSATTSTSSDEAGPRARDRSARGDRDGRAVHGLVGVRVRTAAPAHVPGGRADRAAGAARPSRCTPGSSTTWPATSNGRPMPAMIRSPSSSSGPTSTRDWGYAGSAAGAPISSTTS